jgi:hypothetical protein
MARFSWQPDRGFAKHWTSLRIKAAEERSPMSERKLESERTPMAQVSSCGAHRPGIQISGREWTDSEDKSPTIKTKEGYYVKIRPNSNTG